MALFEDELKEIFGELPTPAYGKNVPKTFQDELSEIFATTEPAPQEVIKLEPQKGIIAKLAESTKKGAEKVADFFFRDKTFEAKAEFDLQQREAQKQADAELARELRKAKQKFVVLPELLKKRAETPITTAPTFPRVAEPSPDVGEVDIKEPIRRQVGAFTSGALSSIEGIVGAAEWAGVERASKPADKLKEWSQALMPEDPNFALQITSGFGSAAVFFIPGLGFMKGTQMLFALSPRAAIIFGNSAATLLEASAEAGMVYRDNIAQGKDHARLKATATFATNAVLIFLTNKFGIFSGKQQSALKRTIESALLEGGQEGAQQVISNIATNHPILEGVKESVAIGAIIGGSLVNFVNIPEAVIKQRLDEPSQEPASDLQIVGAEVPAIELQKEIEAKREEAIIPTVEIKEPEPKIELTEEVKERSGEILTEYFSEFEEKEVPQEIQNKADKDWEANFAEKFAVLSTQIQELTNQIKNARKEQRDELLAQRNDLEEQLVAVEQSFIDKWRGQTEEVKLEKEELPKEAKATGRIDEFTDKEIFEFPIEKIETGERFKLKEETVAEVEKDKEVKRPVRIFVDNGVVKLVDGFNRIEGAKRAGLKNIPTVFVEPIVSEKPKAKQVEKKEEVKYDWVNATESGKEVIKNVFPGSSIGEFIDWWKSRGKPFINARFSTYTDGEPYFSFQGAEFSFSDFLKRRDELLGEKKEAPKEVKRVQPKAKPQKIVAIAKKLIPKNPALPILGKVLVKDGILTATNLAVGIRWKTDLENGLYQIVGNEFVKVKEGKDAQEGRVQDYPIVPEAKDEVLQFSADAISNAIVNASKHAAKEGSSRYEITGVHIKSVAGRARITGTDSFRLLSVEVGSKILKETEIILASPTKVSQLLASLTGKITVKKSAEHIEFEGENGSVVARTVDTPGANKYPDFEKIYPKYTEQFVVERKSLLNALKELKPFVSSVNAVEITPIKNGLKLYAKKEEGVEKTIEIKANREEIKAKAQYVPGALLMPLVGEKGHEGSTSININFLLDAANVFEGEDLYFSRGEATSPLHLSDKNEFIEAPAFSGGAEGAAIGTFADNPIELGHLKELRPIELPELVELATEISETPSIVKFPRFASVEVDENGNLKTAIGPKKLGQHQAGEIKLDVSLFKKENLGQATKVLAHEIGHLVDWLPDKISKRGNILGRLFTLRRFLKSTYGAEGALDLKEIRNRITKEVLEEEGFTFGELVTGKVPLETKQLIKQKVTEYVLEHAITKKQIFDELYALSKYWRPFNEESSTGSYVNYRKSSSEVYADAISALFNSPGAVERIAPTFYEEFFENLDRKPEVKKAYFELQALLTGDRTVLVKHRVAGVRAMFEEGDYKSLELQKKREAEKKERETNLWFKFKFDVITKNQAVIDKVNEAEARGEYINPDDNPIYYLRESNYLGGKIKALLEMNVQPIFNELQANEISWVDFGEGLFYERIIAGDRSEIANPRGLTPEAVTELYNDFKNRLGKNFVVYQRGAENFRKFLREVSEEAYKEGLYTEELFKQMQENPAYVTFRVLEHLEEKVSARVFKQMGTLKDVDNPANASILKTIATIRAIERNKVTKSIVKFMQKNFEGEIEDAKTRFIGKGRQEPLEPKDQIKQELIILLESGKPKGYYVDPYIAKSFEKAPTAQLNSAISVLRFFNSRVFRPLFITFNLGFQSFNLIRDFTRFWKNIPDMTLLKALKRYKQAALPARRRAFGLPDNPTKVDLEANNMILRLEKEQVLSVTFNDVILGHQELDTQIEAIMAQVGVDGHRPAKNPVYKGLLNVLEWIKKLGDTIETLPKVAGYYELSEKQKMAPREMRDFIRRKIGSPDFLDGGYGKPLLNEILLFSNAIIQGIRADVEVATDPQTRSGWWMKTAMIKFVPQTLMFAVLLGLFGDDMREMMEDASEYDKTNYIIIPLGRDQNGKTIYMRIPADESSRFLGGIYWKMLRLVSGEKDVWKSVGDIASYTGGQLPSLSPILGSVFAVGQFIGGENPYDFFRGRPVLTDDQFRAGGLDATKPFVSWMWEQLGGGTFYKTYTGESVPPQLSVGERFLRLPILSNIVGRFFRISDYGEKEKLRTVSEEVKKEDSRRRLDEKKTINEFVKRFNDDPGAQSKVRTYERDMVKEILGHEPRGKEEKERADRLEKSFAVARNKSIRDPRISALLYATSNKEKLALLKDIRSGISNDEWQKLRQFLKKEKIVSNDLLVEFQRESISNELIKQKK